MTEMNAQLLARLVVGRKRDGRCRYDPLAKQALIDECLKPGVSVARTAMLYGINANLLRTWIAKSGHNNSVWNNCTVNRVAACRYAGYPLPRTSRVKRGRNMRAYPTDADHWPREAN